MSLLRRLLLAVIAAGALSGPFTFLSATSAGDEVPLHSIAHVTRVRPTAVTKRRVSRPAPPLTAATTVLAFPAPPIRARAAFLEDLGAGRILFAHNADERLPIASTTKITTAAVALAHSRLSTIVPVSQRAATIGESTMALRRGERVTVRQLLYGLLLNSGNDAAIALAEHVAGSEERFVGMMNDLARTLHMRNTHYVTAHGLDAASHYSSARDLATMAQYAMRDPMFRQIVSTESYHIAATKHNQEHWLASINKVMYWYPGVDGVKPGQTDAAGLCQVITVQRNGHSLIAVLLNTPDLVTDIRNLLNFGVGDFQWIQSPYWGDMPANSISGGSGIHGWTYFVGAGHYVRGLFLMYFHSHGGLQTFGYPRTEQIRQDGDLVQYFQGQELVYDPSHRSVYPAALGRAQAGRFASHSLARGPVPPVAKTFAGLYKRMGGKGVLGLPVTGMSVMAGVPAQFYQYGEIGFVNGVPYLVPIGDAELRLKGWLPAAGASDVYPATMASGLIAGIAPPRPSKRVVMQRRFAPSLAHRGRTLPSYSRQDSATRNQ